MGWWVFLYLSSFLFFVFLLVVVSILPVTFRKLVGSFVLVSIYPVFYPSKKKKNIYVCIYSGLT